MKKLLAVLLCGVLIMSLCACGGSGGGDAEQTEEQAAETAEETAGEQAETAADPKEKTETPEKEKTAKLEESDAIRLATDYAVKTAVEEQEEGLVLEVESAEILDQNADAWLVSIPCLEYYEGEAVGGFVYIYWVNKKNGKVKLVTGAQDYWDGMIDITKGEIAENAAETEYAD